MKTKTLNPLNNNKSSNYFLLVVVGLIGIILCESCRRKCADHPTYYADNNCIQMQYLDSLGNSLSYIPTITLAETNAILNPSTAINNAYLQQHVNFVSDYLPFNINHSTNTFIFKSGSQLDTISLSALNPKAIYTNQNCGFQIKVSKPIISKNTFAKHYKCEWSNWDSATQTTSLKIIFK